MTDNMETRARALCTMCGGVGGVWTADPNADPDADRVPCPTCPRIVAALREAYEQGADDAVQQIADGLRARGAGRLGNHIVIPPDPAEGEP